MYCEYYHAIMIIVLPSFLLGSAETKSGVRTKRILYGHEAEDRDRDAYNIFRYYVALTKSKMGRVDENPPPKLTGWQSWFHPSPDSADIEDFHCGGSLLTPNIVQTACHCLSRFNRRSKRDNFTWATPFNVWETRIYSYLGTNTIGTMFAFLVPSHYAIYEQCRIVEHGVDIVTMDFGFIVTKDSVLTRAKKAAISYAPVYEANTILEYYYETVKKEFMCLVVGHGYWDIEIRRGPYGLYGDVKQKVSDFQRWGWRNAMNYLNCLSSQYPPDLRQKKRGEPFVFFNYTRDNTLVCLKAFTDFLSARNNKFTYNIGAGDSGGPVTCNSVFFAVVSSSDDFTEDILSYVSPIAFTMFENAAEYREPFRMWIEEYYRDADRGIDKLAVPLPTFPELLPTPPPDLDVHPLSRSSFVAIQHHIIIPIILLFLST